mmetsp:Transcript_37718/g.121031  ORF Transcript_37718/g.121031 Transcript_37718/m.121031 type:complete len:204 (-) Transcript_37718:1677-2288(-)
MDFSRLRMLLFFFDLITVKQLLYKYETLPPPQERHHRTLSSTTDGTPFSLSKRKKGRLAALVVYDLVFLVLWIGGEVFDEVDLLDEFPGRVVELEDAGGDDGVVLRRCELLVDALGGAGGAFAGGEVLLFDHGGVGAVDGEEAVVGAALDDGAVVHDVDVVAVLDGGEAVGDGEGRGVDGVEGALDVLFGDGVQGGRRFVEDY